MKPWIDTLVWVHETLAAGGTVTRFSDDKVIVLNRTGGPGLLTALNFDTFNRRTITCGTGFGPRAQLHDYTGRHNDIWTDDAGNATSTIPATNDLPERPELPVLPPGAGLDRLILRRPRGRPPRCSSGR